LPAENPFGPNLKYRGLHSFRLSLALAGCVFVLALSLGGCGQQTISKAELRSVTSEVVSAAQKIAGRKAAIEIRPEILSAKTGIPAQTGADSIYVSLPDVREGANLKTALGEIARRHHLTVSEADSSGVARYDFSFHGVRTHSIHVVTPLGPRAPRVATIPKPRGGAGPRLAIIIDDMGYDRAAADSVLALGFPLTVSVLPHLPLSSDVAEEAFRRGDQVMLHLPMQSEEGSAKPEDVELRVGMGAGEVKEILTGMLDTVPHVAGVNNHQGSLATSDPALMAELMPELRARGLFFIDSRTEAKTVAYDAAKRAGVRAASRKVFLDDTASREAIVAQLQLAAKDAQRDGSAIAIGHPRPATIAALAQEVPRLETGGIQLVFASELVQ
jgi:polysaccharide deacetylase 2 family uncharacterized protein YibQ